MLTAGLLGAVGAQAAEEPPQVRSAQPDIGPRAGGTTVTIQGRGFGGATAVRFGDAGATSFTVTRNKDDTADTSDYDEITAVSPPHAEGLVHVTVTTLLGTSLVNGDCSDSGPTGLDAPPCDEFSYYGELRGGTWSTTGLQAKGGFGGGQATVLLNGKVLLTGPLGAYPTSTYDPATGRTAVSGAELYDPATGRWSSCTEAAASANCPGPMFTSRSNHTATLLKDGRVLIVGGVFYARRSFTAEIYDPATGKFTRTADMGTSRYNHTATLLPDGRVLVAGGVEGAREGNPAKGDPGVPGNTTEIYDPATGQWTPGKPFTQGVDQHTATSLASGRVLLAGGRRPPNPTAATDTDTSRLYDPGLDAWTSCSVETVATPDCPGPLVHPRFSHSATLLADGKVLAAGGERADGVVTHSSAELYDPQRGVWTETRRMGQARSGPVAARLPNGRVLVAGGNSRNNSQFRGLALSSAELYDPASASWSWAPFMPDAKVSVAAALPTGPWTACATNCGKVLVVRDGPDVGSLLFSPTPRVAAVSPPSGSSAGGTPVAITGTGLASVSSVKFDGVEAQRIEPDGENPDGKLVAVTPAHVASVAGTQVEVTVTADGGSATTGFVYVPAPDPGPGPTPGPGGGGGTSTGGGPTVGAGGALTQATTPGIPQGGRPVSPGAPSVAERSALKRCLAKAKRKRSRSGRRSARRRCLLPGRVSPLKATALSASEIKLTFAAPGSVGRSAPPAGRFVVKQSPRRIRSERDFRGALTLCRGVCRFGPTRVGQRITLTVTGLRPRATYYYAVKALGASGRAGPRSKTAKATTRSQSAR